MQSTGMISDISIEPKTNKAKITVLLDSKETLAQAEGLRDKKLSVEIKKHREKRSLDANAYCWVLIGKISEEMDVSKDLIYQDAIRNIGTYITLPIKDEAVERFTEIWKSRGLGWVCDVTKSKLEGFTNVLAYHGSSCYNTKEMSRLIDVIVQECQQLGIETKTPEELKSLKEEWGK